MSRVSVLAPWQRSIIRRAAVLKRTLSAKMLARRFGCHANTINYVLKRDRERKKRLDAVSAKALQVPGARLRGKEGGAPVHRGLTGKGQSHDVHSKTTRYPAPP